MPPYGLLCIAAVLERAGHHVELIDTEIHGCDDDEILSRIDSCRPELIGMSVFTIGSREAIARAAAIKRHCSIPIVAGGPHTFVDIDNFTRQHEFDYFIAGEGERTIIELTTALQTGDSLSNIPGLIYRQNGRLFKNPPRQLIEDIDELPFPSFHLLNDLHEYHPSPLGYRKRPCLPFVSSRGCPFGCVFCSSLWGKRWRSHSADYVINAVERLSKIFGAREIWFCDDTFGLDGERLRRICSGIIRKGLDMSWTCMTNVHNLDGPTLGMMKKAGCWQIQLGLESGNNDVLKSIGKPATVEVIRNQVELISKSGISPRGYFILDNLTDTQDTLEDTISFALSLPLYSADFHLLQLPLGSKAREIAHEYGTVDPSLDLLTGYSSRRLSFVPNGMSEKYLFEMQRRAHRRFFLRPSQICRMLHEVDSLEDVRRFYLLFKAFMKTL